MRLGLDLVVLILNDAAYGMIRWKQQQMKFSDYGLKFNNPDFTTYAHSYGANGRKIESVAELGPALQECFDEGGVHLLDVAVDYTESSYSLHEEIPAESAALAPQ